METGRIVARRNDLEGCEIGHVCSSYSRNIGRPGSRVKGLESKEVWGRPTVMDRNQT
jgi:hypothetical protein